MTRQLSQVPSHAAAADIMQVPPTAELRDRIRAMAANHASHLDPVQPPTREALERAAGALLAELRQPPVFLGFAMVAVNNAFWWAAFQGIPTSRRLLLLPHCLSDRSACAGTYDSVGLNCAGCGRCSIHLLKAEAEELGYRVIVAEGTSSVLMSVLEGQSDAILGVACLDSLEKSFHRIVELGVPHIATPLLRDGCADTEAESALVRHYLRAATDPRHPATRSYVPLLRQSTQAFQEPLFTRLLGPIAEEAAIDGALGQTARAAIEFFRDGGKRLRPFTTLACYAIGRHGPLALAWDDRAEPLVPEPVLRVAMAIEALHKASLVHDDIEDDDAFRYGRQTLHRQYGVGPAVNMGDWLIGLGYRLIAGERQSLGSACIADVLARLAQTHLELCRGQGAELLWQQDPQRRVPTPREVLHAYSLKTAPAFEAALYAGLRVAEAAFDDEELGRLARYVGEAFQILNDLEDWRADDRNKRTHGQDALQARPTLLRAFAAEAEAASLAAIDAPDPALPPGQRVDQLCALYRRCGAFARAQALVDKLRARAMETAQRVGGPAIAQLMGFLVRLILPERPIPARLLQQP